MAWAPRSESWRVNGGASAPRAPGPGSVMPPSTSSPNPLDQRTIRDMISPLEVIGDDRGGSECAEVGGRRVEAGTEAEFLDDFRSHGDRRASPRGGGQPSAR